MPELSPPDRRKMVAILGRLASDQAGEVVAAAHLASSMMRKNGLCWEDLLGSGPEQKGAEAKPECAHDRIREILKHAGLLSEWERSFLTDLLKRRAISVKQRSKIDEITQQLRERKAW